MRLRTVRSVPPHSAAPLDELLRPFRDAPDRSAILLDVDGVLAPIVQQPDDAHMPETTRRPLIEVARRYAVVACVSGAARVGRPPDRLARLDRVPRQPRLGGPAPGRGRRRRPTASSRRGRGACRASCARPTTTSCAACACGSRTRRRSPRCTGAACPTRRPPRPRSRRGQARRGGRATRRTGAARCWRSARPCGSTRAPGVMGLLRDLDLAAALYVGDDTTDLDAFRALGELVESRPARPRAARRRALGRGPAAARGGGRRDGGRHGRGARPPPGAARLSRGCASSTSSRPPCC